METAAWLCALWLSMERVFLGMCVSRAHLGPQVCNENSDFSSPSWLSEAGGRVLRWLGLAPGWNGPEAGDDRDLGTQGLSSWAPAFPHYFLALCFFFFFFLFLHFHPSPSTHTPTNLNW